MTIMIVRYIFHPYLYCIFLFTFLCSLTPILVYFFLPFVFLSYVQLTFALCLFSPYRIIFSLSSLLCSRKHSISKDQTVLYICTSMPFFYIIYYYSTGLGHRRFVCQYPLAIYFWQKM